MNNLNDFNQNKKIIEQMPDQFFSILQNFLKQTNAEFIFLEADDSDGFFLSNCLVGYEPFSTLRSDPDFYSFVINNSDWRLEKFKEKDDSLVSDDNPFWNKILLNVENDVEYNLLVEIYQFFEDNRFESFLSDYFEYEIKGGKILITKSDIKPV